MKPLTFGTNAVLKIVLSGPATHDDPFNGFDGFDVEEGPTTIRGLVINGFKQAQNGSGGQAIGFFNLAVNTNNVVEGNFIGTNAAGTAIAANDGDGVIINGPLSTGNTIGGTTPAARNLISGNDEQGVEISASDSNKVQGNLIGTDKTGTSNLGNLQDGIRMAVPPRASSLTTSSPSTTITGWRSRKAAPQRPWATASSPTPSSRIRLLA